MRRFLPSLSALQAFDSAARHMSFTRAAEDLMLTQSGISRQIGNLEAYLGIRLFERTGSRLVLTDAGKSYADEVAQMLDRLEEVSIDAVRGRKTDASVMLGLHPTFAGRWLVPRLAGFVAASPEVPVEVLDLGDGAGFDADRVDVAVLRGLGTWPMARVAELFAERLVVVCAPALGDLVAAGAAGQIDFNRLPTLQNARRPSLWLSWLRASGRGFEGAIQGLRFPESELLIRAAVAGLGLAVVPEVYVEGELASGVLIAPFGAGVPSGESFWVVVPESKAVRPDVSALRDWLLREARIRPRPDRRG